MLEAGARPDIAVISNMKEMDVIRLAT